jgi:hypothetical protein
LLILFLAFQHKPGWYKPARIDRKDADALQAVRREVTNRLDDFGRKLVEGKPFEFTISDTAINHLLTILPDVWPEAGARIPREIVEPAVAFENGGIRIGAILNTSNWLFVAGARCLISVAPDSSQLRLTLDGVSGGSLPIPRSIIMRSLERVHMRSLNHQTDEVERVSPADLGAGRDSRSGEVGGVVPTNDVGRASPASSKESVGRASPASTNSNDDERRAEPALQESSRAQPAFHETSATHVENVTSPAQLFNGVSIRNDFTWPNGKRRFRIRTVNITDGQIHLAIEPL